MTECLQINYILPPTIFIVLLMGKIQISDGVGVSFCFYLGNCIKLFQSITTSRTKHNLEHNATLFNGYNYGNILKLIILTAKTLMNNY